MSWTCSPAQMSPGISARASFGSPGFAPESFTSVRRVFPYLDSKPASAVLLIIRDRIVRRHPRDCRHPNC